MTNVYLSQITYQMELLHVGVNVAEHGELLWGNLRREHASADTTDPANTSNTSNHSSHIATRRRHLLHHRTRHLNATQISLNIAAYKDESKKIEQINNNNTKMIVSRSLFF